MAISLEEKQELLAAIQLGVVVITPRGFVIDNNYPYLIDIAERFFQQILEATIAELFSRLPEILHQDIQAILQWPDEIEGSEFDKVG